ncbi:MAG: CDGSH iron-sulfur domain-containing protein, partial [Litorimonas sp.]
MSDRAKDVPHRPVSGAGVTPETEVVEGDDVRLYFDGQRCIHARYCVSGAPETFVGGVEGDWLYPDRTETGHLVHVAKQCPSGAIQYDARDGGPEERAPEVNTLRVWENGPYAVHAEIELDGKPDGFRRVLCRCGLSSAKPYCDGSHNGREDAGDPVDAFVASGEPPTRDMTALEVRGGPLRIDPQLDGPLMVSGNLEIMAGT